jgi:hypothetical protein
MSTSATGPLSSHSAAPSGKSFGRVPSHPIRRSGRQQRPDHLFGFGLKWQRFPAVRLAGLDNACMLSLDNLPPRMVIPRCEREIGSFDFQPWTEVTGAIPR